MKHRLILAFWSSGITQLMCSLPTTSPVWGLVWAEPAGETKNRARESAQQPRGYFKLTSHPSYLAAQIWPLTHFTALTALTTQEHDVLTPNICKQEFLDNNVDNEHWSKGPKDTCSKEGESVFRDLGKNDMVQHGVWRSSSSLQRNVIEE